MRDTLLRPAPSPPLRAHRGARTSSEALRHRAVQLWANHWHGAHAPAWASRDAFISSSGADPFLTVDSWLAVTEPRAAWIAVEQLLPRGRVRYLAHRSWDAWWPIWRMVAPRLGTYPVAALASWLDASVHKGAPVDPRPHLAAPHPPDPARASGPDRTRWGSSPAPHHTSYYAHPTPPATRHPPRATRGWFQPGLIAALLVALGMMALVYARRAQQAFNLEHVAQPAVALALGLLGTALGLVHTCAPLELGEDPHLHVRRIWPLYLSLVTWIPLIRAIA
jgi:hypothetical protein